MKMLVIFLAIFLYGCTVHRGHLISTTYDHKHRIGCETGSVLRNEKAISINCDTKESAAEASMLALLRAREICGKSFLVLFNDVDVTISTASRGPSSGIRYSANVIIECRKWP